VVLRFGAYNRTTQPGLNYHLPVPIERVLTPSVTRVNRTEIGYRSAEGPAGRGTGSRQLPEEALMLTGDENIVDINFAVFWVIKDAKAYLFNIRAPDATVKSAAESAMREVIGETPIAQALAEGRGKIESDTHGLLQGILDTYGAGIEITQVQLQRVDPPGPVIDAFRDVQRALADRERLRNEAEAYRNDIAASLPRDHGRSAEEQQQGHRRQIRPRHERCRPLSAAARPRRRQRGSGRAGPRERARERLREFGAAAIVDIAVGGARHATFARTLGRRRWWTVDSSSPPPWCSSSRASWR